MKLTPLQEKILELFKYDIDEMFFITKNIKIYKIN